MPPYSLGSSRSLRKAIRKFAVSCSLEPGPSRTRQIPKGSSSTKFKTAACEHLRETCRPQRELEWRQAKRDVNRQATTTLRMALRQKRDAAQRYEPCAEFRLGQDRFARIRLAGAMHDFGRSRRRQHRHLRRRRNRSIFGLHEKRPVQRAFFFCRGRWRCRYLIKRKERRSFARRARRGHQLMFGDDALVGIAHAFDSILKIAA